MTTPEPEPEPEPEHEPVVDELVADRRVADEPVRDKSVVDKSVADEPVVDKSVAGEPIAADPVVDEPGMDQSIVADSAVDQPAADEAVDQLAADGPVLDGLADEPALDESIVADAVVGGPVVGESIVADSVDDSVADDDVVVSDLPPLAEDADLISALEALLLVVDTPATEELLATALDQSVARVTETLHRMSAYYTERGSGIDLRRVGEGWRFVTRDRHAPFVEKLLLDGQRAKLTRAALETLAVIAYRQPVTRSRVAAVRGVNVDGVIRTLVARGLIGETGTDNETGGILYRTTELFLERLGLSSLEDLPAIAPLLPEVDTIDDV